MDQHRTFLTWPGRTDPLPVMAGQLFDFLRRIAPLHPGLARFLFDEEHLPAPASSVEACERALSLGTVRWKTGDIDRTSYEQRFYVERSRGAPVELTLTCGIEPLGLDPLWVPNRLEILVRRDVGDERASRAVLEGLLRAAVAAFDPDWAFAGSEALPITPLPFYTDGTPVIGWMTYLRRGFPEVPRTLPQPAVVYPVAGRGTLVVAHPEPFHERDAAQRAAMDRVEEALSAARVLVPPSAILRG
jgi:hypothetical protein